LAELEAEATLQRIRACNGASDPDLARVLCLIAASEAQHAEVLDDLARRAREAAP
jgi:mannitol/fructose-specific phosphotransferase system IIA component